MLLSEQFDLRQTLNRIPTWRLTLANRFGYKIPIGKETRPGWRGHLDFYVFRCSACGYLTKDYAHSFPETRYLTCSHCDTNIRWPMCSAQLRYAIALIKLVVRLRLTTSRTGPVTGG